MLRILRSHLRLLGNGGFHNSNRYFTKPNILGTLQEAYNTVKTESSLFLKEIGKDMTFSKDIVPPDEVDIIFKFDGTTKCRDQWILNSDAEDTGRSIAKFDFSPSGTGLLYGIINTSVIKDGRTYKSGYCNITTVPKTKAFNRKDYYDWERYNCLVLRLRGDGRCYMINLMHTTLLNADDRKDAHHYFIYTSGGPYWQDIKIPFSKFVYSVNGVAQPDQLPISNYAISRFGITLGDGKNGPFKLEIDYIGVCFDPTIFEKCAYEPEEKPV